MGGSRRMLGTSVPRNGEQPQGRGRGGGSALRSSSIAASPAGPGASPPRHRAKENTGEPIPPRGSGAALHPGAGAGGPEAGAECVGAARMALLLGAVLLAAGAAVTGAVPGAVTGAVTGAVPAPRELARSVLETHGQELRLLRLLGVTRTSFDWGTHFSINFTARQPPCPKPAPDPRACRGRPGRVQRCSAQVSVFTFLPDVPLSMVECGREASADSAQPRSPGTNPGHSSSSSSSSTPSSSSSRPRPRQGPSRRPLSPAQLQ
nr:uncharacterized protein LOC115494112 isoform X2 [Taeniopygia guttata]